MTSSEAAVDWPAAGVDVAVRAATMAVAARRTVAAFTRAAPFVRSRHDIGRDEQVIAAGEATGDGRPLLAGLGVVEWGSGALVRAGRLRLKVAWRAAGERCVAEAGRRCRICFGQFCDGEPAVNCRCDALFHEECSEVCITCQACGSP